MSLGDRNIVAYVAHLPADAVSSIRSYEKKVRKKFRLMLITDVPLAKLKKKKNFKEIDFVVTVDFKDPRSIVEALAPYQKTLRALTCRGESHIAELIRIIPHVPYLRTSSTESLRWSTDKLEMRRRFALLAKRFTPRYAAVRNNTKRERSRIIEKIGFPMIVKPTNLASSMLVTICYHEDELKKSLSSAYRKIRKVYNENGRSETPNMMVEEFMEGDMYSVDVYVNSRGVMYFCPLVRVITGRNIGRDDFFNYMCISPTSLKARTIEKAHAAARAGVHALGLRNTTAHVELMKIDDEWKLIEIGPRVGGFRHRIHMLSCGIDHALNDILVRFPEKPILPKKCFGFSATLKWYAKEEGRITALKGIKKIQELKSFVEISITKGIGDLCTFAKHGGKPVFVVTLFNRDRSKLLADIRRIEQAVLIQVA